MSVPVVIILIPTRFVQSPLRALGLKIEAPHRALLFLEVLGLNPGRGVGRVTWGHGEEGGSRTSSNVMDTAVALTFLPTVETLEPVSWGRRADIPSLGATHRPRGRRRVQSGARTGRRAAPGARQGPGSPARAWGPVSWHGTWFRVASPVPEGSAPLL